MIGVYINNDLEEKLEIIREWMESREVGGKGYNRGDFNARTGEEGEGVGNKEGEEEKG